MLVDYRKVFVCSEEIALAKSEFEILQLLLSQVGRVFTYGFTGEIYAVASAFEVWRAMGKLYGLSMSQIAKSKS